MVTSLALGTRAGRFAAAPIYTRRPIAMYVGAILFASCALAAPAGAQDSVPAGLLQSPRDTASQADTTDSLFTVAPELQIDTIDRDTLSAAAGIDPDPARPSPLDGEADADRDGVPVYRDWCPDTPVGVVVDASGCTVEARPAWIWYAAGLGLLALLWLIRKAFILSVQARRRSRIRAYGQDAVRDAEVAASTLGTLMPAWQREVLGLEERGEPPHTDPAPYSHSGAGPESGPPSGGSPGASTLTPDSPGREHFGAGVEGGTHDPPWASVSHDAVEAPWHSRPVHGPRDGLAPSADNDQKLFVTSATQMDRYGEPLVYEGEESLGAGVRRYVVPAVALVAAVTMVVFSWHARSDGTDRPTVTAAPAPSSPAVVAISGGDPDPEAPPGTVPARLLLYAGDSQRGTTGRMLPDSIGVLVEDAAGVPVQGVNVLFEATVGGGFVTPAAVPTDSTGIAWAAWRLGRIADLQYVLARVQGYEDGPGVAFEAVALPGAVTRMDVVAGGSQRGAPGTQLDSAIVFSVRDREGNPVAGADVEFEVQNADGSVTPDDAVSDTAGTVRAFLTLGRSGPDVRLTARVRDQPALTAEAVATIVFPRLAITPGVVSGGTHTCLLGRDGRALCWGANTIGQLGSAAETRSTIPALVSSGTAFASLGTGLTHTCGIAAEGLMFCWGDNTNGQLGTGDLNPRGVPTPVSSDVRFRSVSAGSSHTCGVSRSGDLYCWGSNASGQLGDGSRSDRRVPTLVQGGHRYTDVAVGWSHTCAISTSSTAYCWGRNGFGQLGDGTSTDRTLPTEVASNSGFRSIAAGSGHSCGVSTSGQVLCWGQNNHGQLGVGGADPRSEPTAVEGDGWRSVTIGGVHTCGLRMDGTAACWGRNTYGQLGDGTLVDSATPEAVQSEVLFSRLQAGGAHTCGNDPGGATYCWGYNAQGQLGDGSIEGHTVPGRVTGG
jgi:alpha-tubulin suppressor-like RCC1 family protein